MMSSTDEHLVPVVVSRWRRYGHDRAYVRLREEQLGYRDLTNGQICCTRSADVALVREATEHLLPAADGEELTYLPRHAEPEPARPALAAPGGVSGPQRVEDVDLAGNLPGAAARRRAVELRAETPVYSLLAGALGVKTDERSWRIGADGEVEVARRLAELAPQWLTLHAIPVGDSGSDIDHLLIGPGGVFTINTKNRPDGRVWLRGDAMKVNGSSVPYVRTSRHEATRAAALLSERAGFDVEVRALIALVGAGGSLTVRDQPRDGAVRVLTSTELCSYLRSLPDVLGRPSIQRIHDVARHLATWHPRTVAWRDFAS